MTDTAVAEKPNHLRAKLPVGHLNTPADQRRNVHLAIVPGGVKVEDVVKPIYWSHHARVFHTFDVIECVWADGSQEIMLRVLFANSVEAHVSPIGPLVKHGGVSEPTVTAPYAVKYAGPHAKHRVIRTSDGSVVKDGFATKEMAEEYMREHQKVVPA